MISIYTIRISNHAKASKFFSHQIPLNFSVKYSSISEVSSKLGIQTQEDWYQVSPKDFARNGGSSLLKIHGNSLPKVLSSLLPHYCWQPWMFRKVRVVKGFWLSKANRRAYVEWLARELQIEREEDWYKVKLRDIIERGGSGFLKKNDCSFQKDLKELFPNYRWLPWMFEAVGRGFWDSKQHRREFIEWLAEELSIVHNDDWYHVKKEDVIERGGRGFLSKYSGNSLQNALREMFPKVEWQPWKFHRLSNGFWKEDSNRTLPFVKWLESELHIREASDWYDVSQEQLIRFGGKFLLTWNVPKDYRFCKLIRYLSILYPCHPWKASAFSLSVFGKTQTLLYRMVCDLFSDSALESSTIEPIMHQGKYVFRNIVYNTSHQMKFNNSNYPMSFDIFVPSLSLAFEYNGIQHYRYTGFYGNAERQRSLDSEKRMICMQYGVTLIEIDYWWDNRYKSLVDIICLHRPDISMNADKTFLECSS